MRYGDSMLLVDDGHLINFCTLGAFVEMNEGFSALDVLNLVDDLLMTGEHTMFVAQGIEVRVSMMHSKLRVFV